MSQLDEIKERLDKLRSIPTAKLVEFGPEYQLLSKVEFDHARLIKALEAIESHALLAETLCEMNGTEKRLASVPVIQIREAIAAALDGKP